MGSKVRRILSIILAIVMVIDVFPISSFASDDGTEIAVNYEDLEYDFAIGGVAVTEENKDNIFGDGKASYDPEYNTLYLNGVNLTDAMTIQEDGSTIRGGVSIYCLNSEYGFEIIISGINYLCGDIHSATSVYVCSDETGASLTVDGNIFCCDDWSDMYINYSPLEFPWGEAIELTVTGNLYDCDWNLFDPENVPASDTGSILNVNGVNNIQYHGEQSYRYYDIDYDEIEYVKDSNENVISIEFGYKNGEISEEDSHYTVNLGITCSELMDMFRYKIGDADVATFIFKKDNIEFDFMTIDLKTDDSDDCLELDILLNAGDTKGWISLSALGNDDEVASGYCGGDTTAIYDEESDAYENAEWAVYGDGTLEISGNGAMVDYYSENRVTTAPWEFYSFMLTDLVIEDGITSIGDYAFSRIEGFEGTLNLPDSIEEIGVCAFWNTGFTGELALPQNLKIIDEDAFCNVEFCGDLVIPSGVEKIWAHAFQGGCYESVFVPNTVDEIEAPFEYCDDLKSIEFEDGSFYCFENGAILDAETKSMLFEYLPMGYSDTKKPQDEDWRSHVALGKFVIPETVTWIRNWAFNSCYLPENFVIPKNVEKIDGGAFNYCNATDFYFLGDAPEMTEWSFDEDATLYYVSGKSGWKNVKDYSKKTWDGNTVGKGSFGSTGKNLTWICDKDGILTISGSGKMEDDFGSNRP